MIRIAVIGAGRIGAVHARAVAAHHEAELVLVCDPYEANAKALAEEYGVDYVLDPEKVFADERVDAVALIEHGPGIDVRCLIVHVPRVVGRWMPWCCALARLIPPL